MLFLVLIKGDFLRYLESYENPFDYSSIKAVTKNEDFSNKNYKSINSEMNALLILMKICSWKILIYYIM